VAAVHPHREQDHGYTRASDELVSDSAISLGDFLSGPFGFAGAFTWQEDYDSCAVQARPSAGVLNTRASSPCPGRPPCHRGLRRPGQHEWCLPTHGPGTLGHQPVGVGLPAHDVRANGEPSYLWGSAVNGVPSTLLGWPVAVTEKLPAAGAAGDVLLADFRST